MNFVICPNFVKLAKDHPSTLLNDVLLHISNSQTPYRIYCDSYGQMMDYYDAIAQNDKSGLIRFWIDCLAKNNTVKNIPTLSCEDFHKKTAISILKSIITHRNIIVSSEMEYVDHSDDIASYEINLYDQENICKALYTDRLQIGCDSTNLLDFILDSLINMLARKYTHKLEDLHNDILVTSLRQYGFNTSDQERAGKSENDGTAGELDIVLREKMGRPISIIEAFRLASCGPSNTVISKHINKLLNNYDTVGHKRNFIVVYSEAANFTANWNNYNDYIQCLNDKKDFSKQCPILSFEDTGTDVIDKTEIRVGRAIHTKSGRDVELLHIFANFNN